MHGAAGAGGEIAAECVLAAIPVATFVLDAEARLDVWNDAAERLFGWTEDADRGARPFTTAEAEFVALCRQVLVEGTPVAGELSLPRADGSRFHAALRGSPLHDSRSDRAGGVFTCWDITAQREAERELRASERHYRASFEQAAVGIAHTAIDGTYLDVNSGFCAIVGYGRDELLGRTFQEITHPDDREPGSEAMTRRLGGDTAPYVTEKRYLHRDGRVVWVRLTSRLLRDPEGAPEHFVSIVEDISGRKEAEEALRESRERFERAFDHAAVGMALVGLDGRFLQVNEAVCHLTGYAGNELQALTFQDITHPDDLDADLANLEQLLTGGVDSYHMEKRYIRKDGRQIWTLLSRSLVSDAAGAPLYFIVQIQDITTRRLVEEELAASEAQFRTLVEKAPVGICVITSTGTFEQVNEAYAAMLGYEAHELFGRHFSTVMPAGELAVAQVRRRRYLASGEESRAEVEVVHRDGHRLTVLATTVPLVGFDGVARRVSFCLDITDRKEAERVLEHRATHDALTGLANRVLLIDRLQQALASAARHRQVVAALFLDLDGFKAVNDTYGHDRGDELLRAMAAAIVASTRQSDTVARLAGDEFVVVLPDIGSADHATLVAGKVVEALREGTREPAGDLPISASIGISLFPFDATTAEELLQQADRAMYRAKASGKNRIALHDAEATG